MKKIFYILTLFAALVFAGCSESSTLDEVEDKSKYPFYLSDDMLTFSHNGGIRSVVVTVNQPAISWGLDNPWDYDWCTVDIHEKSVTFTVAPNNGVYERIAEYKFYCDGYSVILPIKQMPVPTLNVSKSYYISYIGGVLEIPIETNVKYTVYISKDSKSWISYAGTRAMNLDIAVFNIEPNDEICEPWTYRSSEIRFFDYNDNYLNTIYINQYNRTPNNQIFYTSTDYKVINPYKDDFGDGVYIVSNVYNENDGYGIITFNKDVTKIGKIAFANDEYDPNRCRYLENIIIPASVTEIEDYAFGLCTSLESITIPDSVTEIGNNPFYYCTNLTSFYGKYASEDNKCLIVDGVLKSFAIGLRFTYCNIPDGVTEIGESAFRGSSGLYDVTIPESVTKIGNNAFLKCRSLTSIIIPASVTYLGVYVFQDCSNLASVYFKAVNPPRSLGSYIFHNTVVRNIYVPHESVEAYKSASDWEFYADYIVGYDF